MDILILGGTVFVGRHLVEASLAAGHKVTLFNRGKTNPGLYPDVQELHGDRDGKLDVLKRRHWDIVFDPSGYVPRIVRQSAELLHDTVEHYVFVSSMSVYMDFAQSREGDPEHELEDPKTEDIMPNYGGLKVACERVVTEIFKERALHARPGFIVGAYDPTLRLPGMIRRFDRDGEKVAPPPEQPVQLIHVRDVADWMLHAATKKLSGEYNLTGHSIRMDELLNAMIETTGKNITLTYTSEQFLQEHEIAPVDGLSYWLPREAWPLMQAPIDKALNAGLKLRSLRDTLADAVAWVRKAREVKKIGFTDQLRAHALSPDREVELLRKWHQQHRTAQ